MGIDVLCPVLRRPVHGMLRSLEHATSEPFQVYFLCSPGDEQVEPCIQTGYPTFVMEWEAGRADYAMKMNFGFRHSEGEWLFQGADDIRFSPGWDVEALRVARETGAQVIGTNDLHNPAVLHKAHATHVLFSRAYIVEYGGTFDGSGTVFSEAYDHQYVDNEFIELAKQRRRWAFSEHSHVEHLHPVWGLAAWDETYEKAFRDSVGDRRLYMQRIRGIRRVRHLARRKAKRR